jgi:cyclohexanecarboxylate-CoA ligase
VSKHYWPERLEVIDAIPRNAVGKIQKFLLREQAAGLKPQRLSVLVTKKERTADDNDPARNIRRSRKSGRSA